MTLPPCPSEEDIGKCHLMDDTGRGVVSASRNREQIRQVDALLVKRLADDHAVQVDVTSREFCQLHDILATADAAAGNDAKFSDGKHCLLGGKIGAREHSVG